MQEVVPGVLHWTAFHPGIRQEVSSHFVPASGALIDPMIPAEGIDLLRDQGPPRQVLLTNRHHHRRSDEFVEAFGCHVLCHEAGLHEFDGGAEVEGFAFGDDVAPGIKAREVGAICPEETALHIVKPGALAFADGLIRTGGELGFVPDSLLGDDPEGVKEGLRRALAALLELDFDTLLFAHGEPLAKGGKRALSRFVQA
jgi:hypothetical protein